MSDYPFADYNAALDRFVAQLAEIAPDRLVTRNFQDWEQHPDAEPKQGVYTVLAGPTRDYDYEYRPGDLAALEFYCYGEGKLAEDAGGAEIESAEFQMRRELERLAAEHDPAELPDLVLVSITPSFQTAKPYFSVLSVWRLKVDSE